VIVSGMKECSCESLEIRDEMTNRFAVVVDVEAVYVHRMN